MSECSGFRPIVKAFDWEKRYQHDAWKVTDSAMGHRFAAAIAEGGLLPQYRDDCNPGPIFWWDRHLTPAEHGVCERGLELAMGFLPEDAS